MDWVNKTNLNLIKSRWKGLNTPFKRQGLFGWIERQHTIIQCLQETHLKYKNRKRLS